MNNLARIQIDASYLKEVLHMPSYAEIKQIQICGDYFNKSIEITVESFDLQEVKEGEKIPLLLPIIHQINWDWNQK